MPDFANVIINAGGLGAACYMLYLLHTKALETFMAELALERKFSAEARVEERKAFAERAIESNIAIGRTITDGIKEQTASLRAELKSMHSTMEANTAAVGAACKHPKP